MQRLVYTADIDEEFCGLDYLHEVLSESIRTELGCNVIKSRLESEDEVVENGEWNDW